MGSVYREYRCAKYVKFLSNIKQMQEALIKKYQNFSQDLYRVCVDSSRLKLDFETFNKTCPDKSGTCKYLDSVIILTSKLKTDSSRLRKQMESASSGNPRRITNLLQFWKL